MATFLIKNVVGVPVEINDLGITISAGLIYDLIDLEYHAIADSADLMTAIQNGEIVLMDPDGVTELSKTDSINVITGIFEVSIDSINVTQLLPVVQLRRSTQFVNLPVTWTDVSFDQVDIENDSTVIEQDVINNDRILIKQDGLYELNYSGSVRVGGAARVRINDSTIIVGSEREVHVNTVGIINHTFLVSLLANDYITLQLKSNTGAEDVDAGMLFVAKRVEGIKGDKGDVGAGSTINIQDTSVPLGSFDTLNIEGAQSVTDSGGGVATINVVSLVGGYYQYAEDNIVSTTTSKSWQEKLKLTTISLPAGTYRIGWYWVWNYNRISSDFRGRVQLNDIEDLAEYRIEPHDSGGSFGGTGTDQRFPLSGFVHKSLTAGVHTIDVDWCSSSTIVNASIWDVRIEFWRV